MPGTSPTVDTVIRATGRQSHRIAVRVAGSHLDAGDIRGRRKAAASGSAHPMYTTFAAVTVVRAPAAFVTRRRAAGGGSAPLERCAGVLAAEPAAQGGVGDHDLAHDLARRSAAAGSRPGPWRRTGSPSRSRPGSRRRPSRARDSSMSTVSIASPSGKRSSSLWVCPSSATRWSTSSGRVGAKRSPTGSPQLPRQVGHLLGVVDATDQPRVDLTGPVGGLTELGDQRREPLAVERVGVERHILRLHSTPAHGTSDIGGTSTRWPRRSTPRVRHLPPRAPSGRRDAPRRDAIHAAQTSTSIT
jgi:hypothetical protein